MALHQQSFFFAGGFQFVFKLLDVILVLRQQSFMFAQFIFQHFGSLKISALFKQRFPGQIITPSVDGQIGPVFPVTNPFFNGL